MRKSLALMGAFWSDPRTTGAFVPSSSVLARALAAPVSPATATTVVELGAGTGAITRALFRRGLQPSQYLGVEVNPDLTVRLRREFRGATFVQDSAANLVDILHARGIQHVSHVISSLPWTLFSPMLQTEVLGAVASVLRPGGRLLTFTYVPAHALVPRPSRHFHGLIRRMFRMATLREVVWRNIPPALLWECWNG